MDEYESIGIDATYFFISLWGCRIFHGNREN